MGVKKVVVKAKAEFHKVGKSIKRHAKLMKIKVHVRPKDCRCAPKKAHHKMIKKHHVIVGKNGHGLPPKKFLPKKKITKKVTKKPVIVGKNGHGLPPKKFLPKKKITKKVTKK